MWRHCVIKIALSGKAKAGGRQAVGVLAVLVFLVFAFLVFCGGRFGGRCSAARQGGRQGKAAAALQLMAGGRQGKAGGVWRRQFAGGVLPFR